MAQLRLTDIVVKALKGTDRYVSYMDTTTRGFGVRVGLRSKTWIVVRGKGRERITIGRYPDLSLADARAEAKRLLSATPESKLVSKLWHVARDEFLEQNYADSTSRWPHIVKLTLTRDFKGLDHRKLSDITDADIRKVLDKLASTPSAQLHAYRIVRTFLTWCTRPPRRYLKHSPMEGYPAPGKDRKGTRILTDDELKAVWKASGTGSRQVLRLMILWGTRNEETCSLARAWRCEDVLTIPGASTKNGRDHGIPVLPLAARILDARPHDGPFYFPGRHTNEKSLTAGSLNRILDDVQKDSGTSGWHLRDIRRTFRSNMARLKVPRDVCEVLINHAPPVLDEIYDRYDRLEEKRDALAKYEAFLLALLSRD